MFGAPPPIIFNAPSFSVGIGGQGKNGFFFHPVFPKTRTPEHLRVTHGHSRREGRAGDRLPPPVPVSSLCPSPAPGLPCLLPARLPFGTAAALGRECEAAVTPEGPSPASACRARRAGALAPSCRAGRRGYHGGQRAPEPSQTAAHATRTSQTAERAGARAGTHTHTHSHTHTHKHAHRCEGEPRRIGTCVPRDPRLSTFLRRLAPASP